MNDRFSGIADELAGGVGVIPPAVVAAPVVPLTPQGFRTSTSGPGMTINGALDGSRGASQDGQGRWTNALGLASTETHRHVAAVWQEQCVPFPKFREEVEAQQRAKRDLPNVAEHRVRLTADLGLPNDLGGIRLTDYAVEGLGGYAGLPAPMTSYLMERGDHADLARFINRGLNDRAVVAGSRASDSFLLRNRMDGEQEVCRAVLSGKYGVINNLDMLAYLADSIDSAAWDDVLSSHVDNDGDNMFGNLLLPDRLSEIKGDSEYGMGIAFSNSEVGRYTYRVSAFLFRAICLNGCIWDKQSSEIKVNKKHLGVIDHVDLRKQTKNAVRQALTQGNDLLAAMGYTHNIGLSEVRDDAGLTEATRLVASLSRKHNLTIEQGKRWEQVRVSQYAEPTAFSVVNSLTEAAQKFSGETRFGMEAMAGRILTPALGANADSMGRFWESHRQQAKTMDAKLVQKYQYVNVGG